MLNLRDIGAIKQEVSHEELLGIAEPYIQAFIDNLFTGDVDTSTLERSNVRTHFKVWLPKYHKLTTSSNDNQRYSSEEAGCKSTVPDRKYNFGI